MNENNYKKYIVTIRNYWEKSLIIDKCTLNICKDNNFIDWDMKRVNYNYYNTYLENYYIGYSLLPYDNFMYLNYNKSKKCSWVNNDWLPFWGKLTEKKSKLLKEIEFFWINKLLLKYNINQNIIFKIKEKIEKNI